MYKEITAPQNAQDGLTNFLQMIVNQLWTHNPREASLLIIDLINDMESGIYEVRAGIFSLNAQIVKYLTDVNERLRAGNTWEAMKMVDSLRKSVSYDFVVTMDDSPVDLTPDASGVNKR